MTEPTALRTKAFLAYQAWSGEQTRLRDIEQRERVRRANRRLEDVTGIASTDWQRSDEFCISFRVKLACTIDGITFGASFEPTDTGIGNVGLHVQVLNEEGDMWWPEVYDLADLGRYLAEDEENRAHFAQLSGQAVNGNR